MSDLTVKEFIDVVHRSQLIEKDQLIEALSICKSNGALPDDPDHIAEFLRSKGLITAWQQRNLLQGKSRGFFLGNYRLLNHLGTGGMSSVFLAEHQLIDRRVAIKVLPTTRLQNPSFLDRFEREARATSLLSHPNIVRVFDIDEQDGTHFMVMEYVSGKDLKAMLAECGPLSLEKAAHYIAQAATGLQHAHERGLVHRDIKPANLVVNEDDVVKVLDLGLARVEDDDELASLTVAHAEHMMGTADYLAPEQALNPHAVDHRADIYSLGCTFYCLLAGHPPFTEGTIAQRIMKHQSERPLDIRALREDCPHAVADVCMTMLAKDPESRIGSGRVVAGRLHRWLMSQGFSASTATYATGSDSIPAPMPGNSGENTTESIPLNPEPQSLAETRKVRRKQRIKAPIGLWIFLSVAVLICLALLAIVLLDDRLWNS